MKHALIIQTAFLGDVILTLPLVQALKRSFPDCEVDFVAIPDTALILKSHPDIARVIVYDKHGSHGSLRSFLSLGKSLHNMNYDYVLSPHRSLRSCLLVKRTRAATRVGFDRSVLRRVFTDVVPWKLGVHDIDRNLSLLRPLGITVEREGPRLFVTDDQRSDAEKFLHENGVKSPYIVIAPGTVWPTKRYLVERMAEVADELLGRFEYVVVIGGPKDKEFEGAFNLSGGKIVSAIGKLSIMSSAEIIRRAALLIANDSAPVHVASAFDTPTVAIFGPTVKEFGFYPYHRKSIVVETEGLLCRPCSIHGGRTCPTGTFDCMRKIMPDTIVEKALALLETRPKTVTAEALPTGRQA